jgi:hypothetical protein
MNQVFLRTLSPNGDSVGLSFAFGSNPDAT